MKVDILATDSTLSNLVMSRASKVHLQSRQCIQFSSGFQQQTLQQCRPIRHYPAQSGSLILKDPQQAQGSGQVVHSSQRVDGKLARAEEDLSIAALIT